MLSTVQLPKCVCIHCFYWIGDSTFLIKLHSLQFGNVVRSQSCTTVVCSHFSNFPPIYLSFCVFSSKVTHKMLTAKHTHIMLHSTCLCVLTYSAPNLLHLIPLSNFMKNNLHSFFFHCQFAVSFVFCFYSNECSISILLHAVLTVLPLLWGLLILPLFLQLLSLSLSLTLSPFILILLSVVPFPLPTLGLLFPLPCFCSSSSPSYGALLYFPGDIWLAFCNLSLVMPHALKLCAAAPHACRVIAVDAECAVVCQ